MGDCTRHHRARSVSAKYMYRDNWKADENAALL